MKVLISEKLSDKGLDILREAGLEPLVCLGLSPEQIRERIADCDALIVRSATQVNRELIEAGRQLKVVGRAGSGVDNIDIPCCTQHGIVVVNTPEANTNAAAELAVAMAMSIFRNLPRADRMAQADDFRRGKLVGEELAGKTAGIIGLGHIGTNVAKKLQGLGMEVIAFDEYTSPERFEQLHVRRCRTLAELLREADLISLHTPKTRESYNMIDAEQLAQCRRGVRIVNAARGGLVNEEALDQALETGQVAAAALDVLDREPNYNAEPGTQTVKSPLLSHPNVLITPHLGASTIEAAERVSTGVCRSVAKVLGGGMVPALNLPIIPGSAEEIAPWLRLAQLLGMLCFRSGIENLLRLEIHYHGKTFAEHNPLIDLAAQMGLIKGMSDEHVSMVNVEVRIRELGIRVESVRDNEEQGIADGPDEGIALVFVTDNERLCVTGTLYGGDVPVLVSYFGYRLDLAFAPHMLAIQNKDIPGIIGRVGTCLGEAGINISAVHWSSKAERKRAEAVLAVDQLSPRAVLGQLRAIPGVLRVSALEFEGFSL